MLHMATLPSGRYYFDGMDEQQRLRVEKDRRKRLAEAEFARAEREEHKRFREQAGRLTLFFFGGMYLILFVCGIVALTE